MVEQLQTTALVAVVVVCVVGALKGFAAGRLGLVVAWVLTAVLISAMPIAAKAVISWHPSNNTTLLLVATVFILIPLAVVVSASGGRRR